MVGCVAFNCSNRSENQNVKGLSFHRFPVDPERKMAWLCNMNIEDWAPSPNDRLCSSHFEDKCFYRTASTRRLLSGANPTIFASHPIYQSSNRGIKRSRIQEQLVPAFDPLPEPSTIPDTTAKLKKKLFRVQHRSQLKTKKIRILNQSLKRWKRRICSLKQTAKSLKTKHFMSAENLVLVNNMTEFNRELLKRGQKSKTTYTPELRNFAITLNCLSPNAYDYVRNTFNMSLPHSSTIGKWFQTVTADAGDCISEASAEIKQKATSPEQAVNNSTAKFGEPQSDLRHSDTIDLATIFADHDYIINSTVL